MQHVPDPERIAARPDESGLLGDDLIGPTTPSEPAATKPAAPPATKSAAPESPRLEQEAADHRLGAHRARVRDRAGLDPTLGVHRQLLDNAPGGGRAEDLITDPEIRGSLSVYLVNQLYDNVDVAAALENRLPDSLDVARRSASGRPARQPATNAVNLAAPPAARRHSASANGMAHEKLVNLLEDKTGPVPRPEGASSRSTCTSSSPSSAQSSGCQRSASQDPPGIGTITRAEVRPALGLPRRASRRSTSSVSGCWSRPRASTRSRSSSRGNPPRDAPQHRLCVHRRWALVLLVRRFTGNYLVESLDITEYRGPH